MNNAGNIRKQIERVGNYIIESPLSEAGGFATVYLGRHVVFKDRPPVAIKLLRIELASEDQYNRFLQEARLLDELRHPHILSIIEAGVDMENGLPYLITEYASGSSLSSRLKRRRLIIEEAIDILSQIGQALQFAHTHERVVVHRDIKPGNILFNARGQALLSDFGIAEVLKVAKTTSVVHILGTYPYMAPEHFEGLVSTKSDQYSLGCVAYELFTGRLPFEVSPENNKNPFVWHTLHSEKEPIPLRQLNPDVPAHIEQAVLKAMRKQREQRFPDIYAFLAALGVNTAELAVDSINGTVELHEYPSSVSTVREIKNIRAFQKTIEQWLNTGKAYFEEERYEEALIAYEQVTRIDSSHAEAYYRIGNALRKLNHPIQALVAYERAIFLNPDYADAYIGQGDIYYADDPDKALTYYQKATSVDRKNARGYYKMGKAFNRLKKYELALDAYKDAINFSPYLYNAHYAKANLLKHFKRYDEALATYNQIIKLKIAPVSLYQEKAALLKQLGRKQEAITVYEQIVQLDPTSIDSYNEKIKLQRELEQYTQVLTTYNELIQHNPDYIEAYYYKAILHERFKQYKEAITTYTQVMGITRDAYQIKKLRSHIRVLRWMIQGKKIKPYTYIAALNPLLIPVVSGILFQSWPFALFLLSLVITVSTAVYYMEDANSFNGSLLAIGFSCAWSWVFWLLSPSPLTIIISFPIILALELFLYTIIYFYGFNYLSHFLVTSRPPLPAFKR